VPLFSLPVKPLKKDNNWSIHSDGESNLFYIFMRFSCLLIICLALVFNELK